MGELCRLLVQPEKVYHEVQSNRCADGGETSMLYPKAIRVIPLPEYRLEIHFDNGECRLFDVKPYLHGEWFSQLLDVNVFNQVKIDGLSVSWPDGQDIAPDCLYVNACKAKL